MMLVTALATPFKEGKTDVFCYEKLVARQVEGGADGLLAVGTTAEAILLNECEKKLLVRLAKGMAPQLPLWVGVESADTRKACEEAQTAQKLGANGVLVAPPAFVKCTPKGFVEHVCAIADAVDVPLMLYNVPSRAGFALDEGALEEIFFRCDRVRFLKDAGEDIGFTQRSSRKTTVLCGNDGRLVQMTERGAKGVVSVVSNVAPKLTKRVLAGGTTEEKALFEQLARLSMLEVNPISVKYMLVKAGIFDTFDVRLPLTSASEATRKAIDALNWEKIG